MTQSSECATNAAPTAPTCLPHRRPAGLSERVPRDQAHSQCGKHGNADTADVADLRGRGGPVPSGSGSFRTDHLKAAEGEYDVAAADQRQASGPKSQQRLSPAPVQSATTFSKNPASPCTV